MELNDNWYTLYEALYGTNFNRLMTIGTPTEGYENYPLSTIDDIRELIEEYYPKNEFYISLYDFNSKDPVISWDRLDNAKYEKYAKKDCILFRFKQNTDIIREEIVDLTEIEQFMFIRRSINLGNNKSMIKDMKNVSESIEKLFNIKPLAIFNGYSEGYLYIFTDELKLKNPTITFYYFYKFIENYADTVTLKYLNIDPFSQIVTMPGSENNYSRLYAKPFDITASYPAIIKNSENNILESIDLDKNQDTHALESLLKTVDDEISKRKSEGNTNAWNYDLDKLFNERRE